jgi:hypothetical protein
VASAVEAAGPVPVEPLQPQVLAALLPQVVADLLPAVAADLRAVVSADSAAAVLRLNRSYSAVMAGSSYTPGKPRWAAAPRSR